eukprot:scaffold95562_cov33-Attheya_sp.AAC.1
MAAVDSMTQHFPLQQPSVPNAFALCAMQQLASFFLNKITAFATLLLFNPHIQIGPPPLPFFQHFLAKINIFIPHYPDLSSSNNPITLLTIEKKCSHSSNNFFLNLDYLPLSTDFSISALLSMLSILLPLINPTPCKQSSIPPTSNLTTL